MKKILISAFFVMIIVFNVQAQGDPTVNSVGFASSTIPINGTTVLKIQLNNSDFVNNKSIPAGGYQVSVSLPATLVYRGDSLNASAFTNVDGVAFKNFTFDGVNVFTADLAAPQAPGQLSNLQIVVKGYILTASQVISNISVNSLIPGVNSTNSPTNDNLSAGLQVVQPLAVLIGDLRSDAIDCSAKITFNTLKEDAGSTFDIEYSPDGGSFVKVGTVAGRSLTGAKYEYSYSQGNGKGFYRLKIGSATGGVTYSKVVNVITKCNQKKVFIYPNPIKNLQNLQINVSNFVGKVTGDLLNAAGQIILTKKLINGLNQVGIANLAEGIYTFKVTDEAKEIQNFKVAIVK